MVLQVLCPQTLKNLSQIDLFLSFLLFVMESVLPHTIGVVHILVLITASASVFMSMLEFILIHKVNWWELFWVQIFRLGPMSACTLYWMTYSTR
jgi:hypothetical protein